MTSVRGVTLEKGLYIKSLDPHVYISLFCESPGEFYHHDEQVALS